MFCGLAPSGDLGATTKGYKGIRDPLFFTKSATAVLVRFCESFFRICASERSSPRGYFVVLFSPYLGLSKKNKGLVTKDAMEGHCT